MHYQSKTDKLFPVRIRVTHNRETAFLPTKFRLPADKITKEKHTIKPCTARTEVEAEVNALQKYVEQMGRKIDNYSARELADHLEKFLEIRAGVCKDYIDFIEYGEKLAEKMIADGQVGQGQKYLLTLRTIQKFTGSDTLNIADITSRWLRQFEEWLLSKPSAANKKNADPKNLKTVTTTGVALYMRAIRAMFNKARDEFNDEDRGEIVISHYPFNKYKIPAEATPEKRALPVDTIRAIRDYIPAGKRGDIRATLARDVFMLSFYLMGMNLVDLCDCAKIEKNETKVGGKKVITKRLNYNRSKTRDKRDDNAEISVLLVPEVDALLEAYADPTGQRVFNFHTLYASVYNFTRAVNKGLQIITQSDNIKEKHITLYAARHSFATIARNDCGASVEEVAACLNHSIPGFKVTDKYLKRDWSQIDNVQRRVLDLLAKA